MVNPMPNKNTSSPNPSSRTDSLLAGLPQWDAAATLRNRLRGGVTNDPFEVEVRDARLVTLAVPKSQIDKDRTLNAALSRGWRPMLGEDVTSEPNDTSKPFYIKVYQEEGGHVMVGEMLMMYGSKDYIQNLRRAEVDTWNVQFEATTAPVRRTPVGKTIAGQSANVAESSYSNQSVSIPSGAETTAELLSMIDSEENE